MAVDNVPPGAGSARTRTRSGLRHRALIPVVLLLAVSGLAAIALSQEKTPSVPLGASAAIAGGLSRINGIIPLESDSWNPAGSPGWLDEPMGDGSHRVRIILELTALELGGMDFAADDYSVAGVGTSRYNVVWAPVESAFVNQGENLSVALVFELPDQAVLLTLDNDDDVRLSLGTDHHSGGQ
ncbi:hypothetical protein IWX64_000382 [Arthrobacter sp. CAN_A212]|uniref:hypothetical protein n=1 Tax=Arthrobacter sp. CAN_A212 TaxID=2787719 RepID=UPI0018CBB72D